LHFIRSHCGLVAARWRIDEAIPKVPPTSTLSLALRTQTAIVQVTSSGAKLDLTGDSLPDGHARAGFARLARQLSLHISGVDADALARGAGAAEDIFRSHGIAPAEADHGRWRRDLCEALGLADDPMILSRRDALAASVWDEAVRAAVAAACPGSSWASCADAQLHLNQPLPLGAVEISP
jgi:hypothetical protein